MAIEDVAVQNDDGSLTISRAALKDAVQSTADYKGIIGTITCTPLGDCATSVTIGVYKVPDVGFLDPKAKPVFTETKTLAQVAVAKQRADPVAGGREAPARNRRVEARVGGTLAQDGPTHPSTTRPSGVVERLPVRRIVLTVLTVARGDLRRRRGATRRSPCRAPIASAGRSGPICS